MPGLSSLIPERNAPFTYAGVPDAAAEMGLRAIAVSPAAANALVAAATNKVLMNGFLREVTRVASPATFVSVKSGSDVSSRT
jgi:hypothetical protein